MLQSSLNNRVLVVGDAKLLACVLLGCASVFFGCCAGTCEKNWATRRRGGKRQKEKRTRGKRAVESEKVVYRGSEKKALQSIKMLADRNLKRKGGKNLPKSAVRSFGGMGLVPPLALADLKSYGKKIVISRRPAHHYVMLSCIDSQEGHLEREYPVEVWGEAMRCFLEMSADSTVRVVDVLDGKKGKMLTPSPSMKRSTRPAAVDENCRYVLDRRKEKKAYAVWDVKSGRIVRKVKVTWEGWDWDISLSRNGAWIVVEDRKRKRLQMIGVTSERRIEVGGSDALVWKVLGKTLIAIKSKKKGTVFYEAKKGKQVAVDWWRERFGRPVLSDNGKYVFTPRPSSAVRDIKTGREILRFRALGAGESAWFLKNDAWLAVSGRRFAWIFDIKRKKRIYKARFRGRRVGRNQRLRGRGSKNVEIICQGKGSYSFIDYEKRRIIRVGAEFAPARRYGCSGRYLDGVVGAATPRYLYVGALTEITADNIWGGLYVYDRRNGEYVDDRRNLTQDIPETIAFSPTGLRFAITYGNLKVAVYDTVSGSLLWKDRLEGHAGRHLYLSDKGNWLLVDRLFDPEVLFDLGQRKKGEVPKAKQGYQLGLPHRGFLYEHVPGKEEQCVHMVRRCRGKSQCKSAKVNGDPLSVRFHPSRRMGIIELCDCDSDEVSVWTFDSVTMAVKEKVGTLPSWKYHVAFGRNGSVAAVKKGEDKRVRFWKRIKGRWVQKRIVWKDGKSRVKEARIDRKGRVVMLVTGDETEFPTRLEVWAAEWGGRPKRIMKVPTIAVDARPATLGPEGSYLLTTERGREILLWRIPKGCA